MLSAQKPLNEIIINMVSTILKVFSSFFSFSQSAHFRNPNKVVIKQYNSTPVHKISDHTSKFPIPLKDS